MNLALFVTKTNRDEMRDVCASLAAMQEAPVNGALCVIHQNHIPAKEVMELTRELASRFAVKVALPVAANLSQSHDAQLALLFSRFLLGAYAKYPGAWLMMDQPAAPRFANFMQLLDKQHAAHGGRLTGKGVLDKGSLLLVGPVTLDIPFQQLKFLRFSTNESWRERGRFFFSRCGFQSIEHDQYLFSFSKQAHAESPQVVERSDVPETNFANTGTCRGSMVSEAHITTEPAAGWPSIEVPQENGHFRGVLSGGESPSMAGPNPAYVDAPVETSITPDMLNRGSEMMAGAEAQATLNNDVPAFVQAEPTKKELLDAVETITGTRPHHFTSEAKLKAMIEQCTTTPT